MADYSRYWTEAVDPDGNKRNRLTGNDRSRYLEDIQEELDFIRGLPAGRICDFGCGPGWLLQELDEWDVVGVEIADDAIVSLKASRIPHCSDVVHLSKCSYDVVFCHHVIEHMDDPITLIGDLRNLLVPGGWLILGTPDFDSPCAQKFGANYRMLHDQTHCSLFTLESMHRFLRDHAFQIRDVRFPFPDRYATPETFARWNDTSKVSPPWPGNWMTFYCNR